MTELDQPRLRVRYELLGRETENVKSYSVDSGFMTSTDGFAFTLYEHADPSLSRGLELQPVELYIDGKLQLVGRIERTRRGDEGLAVKCEGRDYMAEMVECQIDPSFKLADEEPIENALLRGLAPVGITAVALNLDSWRDVRTGGIAKPGKGPGEHIKSVKAKDFKPNPGQGLYEYFNHLLARHGGTMQPVGDRAQVAIAAPNYNQEPSFTIVRRRDNPAGAQNSILQAYADEDYSHFPTFAFATGKQGGVGEEAQPNFSSSALLANIEKTVRALVPESVNPITERLKPGSTKRPTNALYRFFYLKDEESKDQDQLDKALMRAVAERMKDALMYTVVLRGHSDPANGVTYTPDTIVLVQDEISDVDEPLWIERRTFNYSEADGPTTTLTCWRPGSFSIG